MKRYLLAIHIGITLGLVITDVYALPSSSVTKISAGNDHTCALLNDGTVSCWGENYYGQLGNGSDTDSKTPVKVSNLSNVIGISAGGQLNTCALLNDGTVSCWGSNYLGQLGNGSNTDSKTPVKVSNLNNVIGISAGAYHTCALLNDGTVSCWGWNYLGQLGNGSNTNSKTTVKVSNLSNVIGISAGWSYTCALLNDGTVSCWGTNDIEELGNGSNTNSSNTPVKVSNLSNVIGISAGQIHTCALLNDGTVSCWRGKNNFGELGNGSNTGSKTPVKVSNLSNVIGISAGWNHTCALLNDGTVSCWGLNYFGELGNGSNTYSSNTPVKVSNLSNVIGISAGVDYTCALLNDGTVSCWGNNYRGQLGNGSNTNSNIPVSVLFCVGAYVVHDGGLNDSLLLSVNSSDLQFTPIGSVHPSYDLEALALHPQTGVLYAASGENTTKRGTLYKVEGEEVVELGQPGDFSGGLEGLSFNPNTNILWGWAQGKGLVKFDTLEPTPTASQVLAYTGEIQDLTWSPQGDVLYAVENRPQGGTNKVILWAYHPADGSVVAQCEKELEGWQEVEALQALPSGALLFGLHNSKKLLTGTLDPNNHCQVSNLQEIAVPYDDIEGIALTSCPLFPSD